MKAIIICSVLVFLVMLFLIDFYRTKVKKFKKAFKREVDLLEYELKKSLEKNIKDAFYSLLDLIQEKIQSLPKSLVEFGGMRERIRLILNDDTKSFEKKTEAIFARLDVFFTSLDTQVIDMSEIFKKIYSIESILSESKIDFDFTTLKDFLELRKICHHKMKRLENFRIS
jgi:hypothetical protein